MNIKFYVTIFLILFIKALAAVPSVAQKKFRAFYHLTNQNGLSGNTIITITQDTDGFLWLGTPAGLNRYDGRETKCYFYSESNPKSLSSSYITCVLAASNGALWVGTAEGLNYYDPEKESFERIYLNGYGEKYTSKNRINCLYKDKKGRVWIGTTDGIYCLAADKKRSFTRILFNKASQGVLDISSLCEDYSGVLWIGTVRNGLIAMYPDGTKKSGYKYVSYSTGTVAGLTDNNISSIVEDTYNQLWVATANGGLSRFERKDKKFAPIPNNTWSISCLMADRKGHLWIAAPGRLSNLDIATGKMISSEHNAEDFPPASDQGVISMYEDKAGSVWLGSYDGASVTHLTDLPFRTERGCFADNTYINAIAADGAQNILIGTEKGLCVMPPHHLSFAEKDLKAIEAVKTVSKGYDGSIWVGSSSTGLWQFHPTGKTTRFLHDTNDTTSLSDNYVICALEDSQKRLWAGSRHGLNLLNKRTGKFIHFSKNKPEALSRTIYSLFEDSRKNLWIGTETGLCLLRYRAEAFEWFPTTSRKSISFGKGRVVTIYEDKRGQLLIGTHADGLKRYDAKTNSLVSFTMAGMPEDVINLQDDHSGNLWLTSYNQLYKLDYLHKTIRSYNFYDRIPGYVINERSLFRSKTGELFFGTDQGLLRFIPEQVEDNPMLPAVVFTSLTLSARKIGESGISSAKIITKNKNIVLNYWENSFSVNFSVLNYVKPEKNQYAFKLEGLENTWNYSAIPSASYNRLAPGTYTLLAKGSNNDGIWNEKPARMTIVILPPWWKTWWAYSMYMVTFFVILFLITRFFWLRASFRMEQDLQKHKLDFFTNISHEIRSHLMLVSAPIEKMLQSEKLSRNVHRQLGNIHDNSARLSGLVKELMDFRKAESANLKLNVTRNDLVPFLKNIFTTFSQLAETRGIKSSFLTDSSSIELWFDPIQFEKTVYNLLSNAYKFTPDTGYVKMSIESLEETVRIDVTDNGKGIAKENLKKVFVSYFQVYDPNLMNPGHGLGLALSKSIVELHKGTLTVESADNSDENNRKTTFSILMRKGIEHFSDEQIIDPNRNGEAILDVSESPSFEIDHEPTTADSADKNRYTILLAENHEEFRQLLTDTLAKSYKIICCNDGKEAYKMATSQIPDLIVSDIIMPEMNGLELCKKVKNHENTSHIPIILLTAHDSQFYQLKGLQQGADAYIPKPFRLEILELKIRNLLAARKAIQQKFSSRLVLETGNEIIVNNREEQFINALLKYVEENMENPQFSVTMLSKHLGMSEPVLYKKVRALLNMTVNDFIKTIRLKKAAKLLRAGQSPAEVSALVGYSDQKYFSREFKKTYGVTPGKWPNFTNSELN